MKTIFKFTLIIALLSFSQFLYAQETQTEEYAIISVYQKGKKNFISTTIGSISTEEKEYEKSKNDKKYDMAPVIAEMERLNKMGYELFNSSTAMIPINITGKGNTGLPFYVFVFKKKR